MSTQNGTKYQEGRSLPTPKGRILCSEDDKDTRNLISLTLSYEGYDVVRAESAAEALELTKAQTFDLFLVDNWMPGMSSPQLCRAMRELNCKTPILFYSGAGYNTDKEAARLTGAHGYLVKPVEADDFVAEVARLIAQWRVVTPVGLVVHA